MKLKLRQIMPYTIIILMLAATLTSGIITITEDKIVYNTNPLTQFQYNSTSNTLEFTGNISFDRIKHYGETTRYIVFNDDSTTYVKNGTNGKIEYMTMNDSAAIEYALTHLTSSRTWKEKILLKGDFEISKCIEIPSYTVFEIQGKIKLGNNQASHLEFSKHSGQYGIIYAGDENNGATDIEIYGGEIDGNKANNSGYSFYGITFRKVTRGIARSIYIHDTGESGIVFEYGCSTCWIKNCHVDSSGYDGIGCGGFGTINHDIYFVNNKITGTIPHNGITVERSNYRIFITGNLIDFTTETAGNSGINIGGAYDVIVSENHIKCSNQHGIRVDGDLTYKGYNIQLTSNNVFGAQYRGILLSRNVSDVIVSNNIVTNVSNGYGIVLWDYGQSNGIPKDVIISNNRIHSCDNYGIYLLDGNYVRVSNNDVRNNTQGGILIDSGFGTDRVLFGNLGYYTESSGIATITAGNTSVTVSHNLSGTPDIVTVTPRGNIGSVWISSRNSTSFTISCSSAPSSDTIVDWYAEYRP